jgi:hypothetical protein
MRSMPRSYALHGNASKEAAPPNDYCIEAAAHSYAFLGRAKERGKWVES